MNNSNIYLKKKNKKNMHVSFTNTHRNSDFININLAKLIKSHILIELKHIIFSYNKMSIGNLL